MSHTPVTPAAPTTSRRQRVARSGLALSVMALMAGLGTYSAFTDFTESNDNFFESGSLSITDDNLDSEALFEVLNANDGTKVDKCITVENDGTIDYDALDITRSVGVPTVATESLGEDVAFTVTALDAEVDTTGADCAAFDASTDTKRSVAGLNGLANAAGASSDGADLAALLEPGDKASYKISALVEMDDEDQGEDVRGIKLAFAASQGE